ncbi:MAG: hypothetical protein RIF34_07505, partial [Candidatus Kapaibacterium sp.]
MIKQIILLLLAVSVSNSYSQKLPEYLRAETKHFDVENTTSGTHYHKNNRVQDYGDVERRNYDVLHYDLYLDLKDALRSNLDAPVEERKGFSGENRMTVLLTSDVDSIEFDASNLKIGNSTVNGVFPDNVPVVENGLVKIYVGEHKAGDTINVSISYSAIADDEDGFWRNRGMHIYHKGYNVGNKDRFDNPVIVEHNIAYSMSEPELARYWMPCNDRPYDKATSSMNIIVPTGYTAVSNGYLADIEVQTSQSLKNTVLYSWVNNKPITTYLM